MKIDRTRTVDEEFAALRTEGRTGSINDMISQSLRASGLTGGVGDLLYRNSFTTPSGVTVGIPTPISTQGDSWSVRSEGLISSTDYTSTSTARGLGGSLMTAAITRWQSDVVNFPDEIHFFLDGIYDDYSNEAAFITNLNNIATAANNAGVTWFFIGSGHHQPGSASYPGDATALAILALTDTALSLYPDNVIDLRPTLQALNDGSPNDLADVAAGLIPRSLYSDDFHVGNGGDLAIAQLIADTAFASWPQVAVYEPTGTPDTILGANLISHVDPTAGGLLQTTGGAAAASDGDPIQVIPDQANAVDFVSNNLTNRATYRSSGGLEWIEARDSYFAKALSRTGDIYICAAFRFPNAATSPTHRLALFYDNAPFYLGDYYSLQRDPFADPLAGMFLESNTGINFTGEANTTDIYVVELVISATERTFVLRRPGYFAATTTIAGATMTDSLSMNLFGADSDSIETGGDVDLYSLVVANTIPTDTQRDNLVHLAAEKAGLTILPPDSETAP